MNEEAALHNIFDEHHARMSLRGKAIAFLDDANAHIADYPQKIQVGQFLRPATISHVRRLTGLTGYGVEAILDEWIEDQQ